MLLDIKSRNEGKHRKSPPSIYVGGYGSTRCHIPDEGTYTHFPHCTLCLGHTVKYQRLSHFFNIFSVDMWICYVLSLVMAVITARCISNYKHKSHLHESKSYSNIFSVTSNIIAVVLSVSVNTQPRSAPLRLSSCAGCGSVAISSVPGLSHHIPYRAGIRENNHNCGEKMLKSAGTFGFNQGYQELSR